MSKNIHCKVETLIFNHNAVSESSPNTTLSLGKAISDPSHLSITTLCLYNNKLTDAHVGNIGNNNHTYAPLPPLFILPNSVIV